jgi:hypothetical protein
MQKRSLLRAPAICSLLLGLGCLLTSTTATYAQSRWVEATPTTKPKATATAVPTPGSFVTTGRIAPSSLAPEVRGALAALASLPENNPAITRTRKEVCTAKLSPPAPHTLTTKAALALTETDISTEILFEKSGVDAGEQPAPFGVTIDFVDESIMVKSSVPRFPSEAAGVLKAPDKILARPLWIEGKNGASVLVFVLPLRQCATRAVALCPRSFQARSKLIFNGYTPTAARFFVSSKVDGLYATEPNETGTIRASLLTSESVPAPTPWFDEASNAVTPSATLKFQRLRTMPPLPEFFKAQVPLSGSIEARLELGREDRVLRTISKRTTIEVSEFTLPENQRVVVRLADTALEGGKCYLVAKWSETQL